MKQTVEANVNFVASTKTRSNDWICMTHITLLIKDVLIFLAFIGQVCIKLVMNFV